MRSIGAKRRKAALYIAAIGLGTLYVIPRSNAASPPTSLRREDMAGQDIDLALYSADRQEISANIATISNITVAMMTYVGATAAFLAAKPGIISSNLLLLAPAPLWGLFYFELILFAMMAARTRSTLTLERSLLARTGHNEETLQKVGLRSAERLTNVRIQAPSLKPIGLLPYLFVMLGVPAYTGSCISLGAPVGFWSAAIICALATYSALALCACGVMLKLSSTLGESAKIALDR